MNRVVDYVPKGAKIHRNYFFPLFPKRLNTVKVHEYNLTSRWTYGWGNYDNDFMLTDVCQQMLGYDNWTSALNDNYGLIFINKIVVVLDNFDFGNWSSEEIKPNATIVDKHGVVKPNPALNKQSFMRGDSMVTIDMPSTYENNSPSFGELNLWRFKHFSTAQVDHSTIILLDCNHSERIPTYNMNNIRFLKFALYPKCKKCIPNRNDIFQMKLGQLLTLMECHPNFNKMVLAIGPHFNSSAFPKQTDKNRFLQISFSCRAKLYCYYSLSSLNFEMHQ